MVEPMEVRPVRPDEYAMVGELTATAYLADGPVHEKYLPALRDAAARAAHGVLLVAVDTATGELLGTASLFTAAGGPAWAEGASWDDAVLRMLAVAPTARRRGTGRALTRECIRRAREMGLRRLILSTAPSMTRAHALYEQLGFRRDPGADWEPMPGLRLMAYRLPLREGARIG